MEPAAAADNSFEIPNDLDLALEAIEEEALTTSEHSPGTKTPRPRGKSLNFLKPPSTKGEKRLLEEEDLFQASSSSSAAVFSRGKRLGLTKNLRSPPPRSSSPTLSQSTDQQNWDDFFRNEEQRRVEEDARRREWKLRGAGNVEKAISCIREARDDIAGIRWERKSLKSERETLRDRLRALDERELVLDKRERSSLTKIKVYETIVTKFNSMNI